MQTDQVTQTERLPLEDFRPTATPPGGDDGDDDQDQRPPWMTGKPH